MFNNNNNNNNNNNKKKKKKKKSIFIEDNCISFRKIAAINAGPDVKN